MRILQIIQKTQLRGAEIFATQLSHHLVQQGHSVKMIALLDGGAEGLFEDIHILHIKKKKFIDFSALKRIKEIIADFKPDIVQANAADTIRYAVFSKLMFNWKEPIIYRNANLISGFINSIPKKIFFRWLFKKVNAIASVSDICLKDFQETLNWHHKPIAHLPIGVNFPMPTPYADFKEAGLSVSGKNVFVNCAALMPEKNHEGLLRIFKQLQQTIPDSELLIFGEGMLKGNLNKKISELGLLNTVQIIPPRRDILRILPLCKALLMPSLIEGLPAIILESMSLRLPVYAYAIGGIPEVIESENTGYLIEKDNENQFVDLIYKSLNTSEFLKIKENGLSSILNNYDNKIISQKFILFYKKCLISGD